MKPLAFFAFLVLWGGVMLTAPAEEIHRGGWTFDRSDVEWENVKDRAALEKSGSLTSLIGWTEYDFEIANGEWFELWATGVPPEWTHDVFIDGKLVLWLSSSDAKTDVDPKKKGWFKEGNFYLAAGRHTIRFRRLNYPGGLPSAWELRPSGDAPGGSIRVVSSGERAVRTGENVELTILGGGVVAADYELLAREDGVEELLPLGRISFPAGAQPVEKSVTVQFPRQGVFTILARSGDNLLRAADLKSGEFAVVDTKHAPAPAAELKTSQVVDIDCSMPPPAVGFWEKDGPTVVKDSAAGRYRESSGAGEAAHWATDGFSYKIDLPAADQLYRLRVDYPDDERRSMGFWINDGANVSAPHLGVTNGGGVETGDHYPLTGKMLTYEAFFYPRKDKDIIVAIINLVPGMKAAAARIRIDKVDSGLPAAPAGERNGRTMGFYFEENGRWLRFFGGASKEVTEEFKTLERWGQWNRYIGANLMFPTVNVYQNNHFPSRILEGYFLTSFNETRLAALMAEKYGNVFVPEFHLSGQRWFDKRVMGVWADKLPGAGSAGFQVNFASKEAEDRVMRDRDGNYTYGVKPFGYNPLNPDVQRVYIDLFGELADMLKDCESFIGISSRMMLSWQYQGWNTLNGLNWGYDDWTIRQFTKDTGIDVPGGMEKADRFRKRFDFLTGHSLDRWLKWRAERIHDYHKRLLARIQKAKPTAKLFFTYTRTDPRTLYSADMREQLLHAGVDIELYKNERDIVIMPTAMYGRRYSTPIGDAEVLEAINHPGVKAVAATGDRGISLFSNYYEVNRHLDWSKLGGKTYAAFDACIPSGTNERELYAMALADSDCSFIAAGGNGWIFGNPEIMQPFLREYRALPAKPFDRFEKAIDPVAIWHYRDEKGVLWFYAVNRLPTTVNVSVSVGGGDGVVYSAASGEAVAQKEGTLGLQLEPFALRSFRTKGDLVAATVSVPDDFVAGLKTKIASAKIFRDALRLRQIAPEMTEQETNLALAQLNDAIDSFDKGRFGAAYRELERLSLVRAQYLSGRYLEGVLQRSQPHGVPNFSNALPKDFQEVKADDSRGGAARALAYDANGWLWVANARGLVALGEKGQVEKQLSLFEPFSFDRRDRFDRGDIREAAMYGSVPFVPTRMGVARGGVLVAQNGANAPFAFSLSSGRALRLRLGDKMNIKPPCTLLAVFSDGRSLMANASGVTLYDASGVWMRDVSELKASAGAVDGEGRIYLAANGGLHLLDANGSERAVISMTPPEMLAVSEDGKTLVVVQGKGRSIAGYRRTEEGFQHAWKEELPTSATAISFSPGGSLAVALENGRIVSYDVSGAGLVERAEMVSAVPDMATPGATPLRVFGDEVYFLAGNSVMALKRGGDGSEKSQVAFAPQLPKDSFIRSFSFGSEGSLYFLVQRASLRGLFLYRATRSATGWGAVEVLNGDKPVMDATDSQFSDLAVESDGAVIIRMKKPDANHASDVTLYRWRSGSTPEIVTELGRSEVSSGEYGLFALPDGGFLVASGNIRSVQKISSHGDVVWNTARVKTAAPGYVDLRTPLGITADRAGRVYVTDPVRHQVLEFDVKGSLVRAIGCFGGAEQNTLSLNQPSGIAVAKGTDGREWLYVADSGNGRIVKWPLDDSK